MKPARIPSIIGLATVVAAGLPDRSSAQAEFSPLICQGRIIEVAPGVTVANSFSTVRNSSLGAGGHVATRVKLEGEDAGVTRDNDDAIVRINPDGTTDLIIREGDDLGELGGPAGATYRETFSSPLVDREGNVAINASVSGLPGLRNNRAILFGPPGALRVLAFAGQSKSVDEGTGTITSTGLNSNILLNPDGSLVYRQTIQVPRGPQVDLILSHREGRDIVEFRSGVPYAGLPDGGEFSRVSASFINEEGQIALWGSILGGPRILALGAKGVLNVIAKTGEAAPGLPVGVTLGSLEFNSLADNGWLAFSALLLGDGVRPGNDRAVWIGSPGGKSLIAREGHPLADGGSPVQVQLINPEIAVASNGNAVFKTTLESGETGIWQWGEGGLEELAITGGGGVPGFPAQSWSQIGVPGINPTGRIFFSGAHTGMQSFTSGTWAVDEGGVLRSVAQPGDRIVISEGVEEELRSPQPLGEVSYREIPNGVDGTGSNANEAGEILSFGGVRGGGCLFIADIGATLPSSIAGRLVNDENRNGFPDENTPLEGLAVTLFLDDGTGAPGHQIGDPVPSNDNGEFEFSDIDPGNYVIQIDEGGKLKEALVNEATGETTVNHLASAGTGVKTIVDIALLPPLIESTNISVVVLEDLNGNGIRDENETRGLPDFLVLAKNLDDTDAPRLIGGTDEAGEAIFETVREGRYIVGAYLGSNLERPLEMWAWTSGSRSIGGHFLSQVSSVPAEGGIVFLAAKRATISGSVRDGTNLLVGLEGARVRLLNPDGSQVAGTRTVTTDKAGSFSFDSILPGTYFLEETDLPGYASDDNNHIEVPLTSGTDSSGHNFVDRLAKYSISLHALNNEGIENLNVPPEKGPLPTIEPIRPVHNPEILRQQPWVTEGLVADGVTPLLIRFGAKDVAVDTEVHWTVDTVSGGSIEGGIEAHLSQLGADGWQKVNPETVFQKAPLAPGQPFGFICVGALEPSMLLFDEGSQEIVVDFDLYDAGFNPVTIRKVAFRRPPLALDADGLSEPWGKDLLTKLPLGIHPEFVFAHTEGFSSVSSILSSLDRQDRIQTRWAITRVDIVAQGRVLLALRQRLQRGDIHDPGFRGAHNHYRGGLRRVIAVGAPNNGSRLQPYLRAIEQRLKEIDPGVRDLVAYLPSTSLRISSWNRLQGASSDWRGIPRDLNPWSRYFRPHSQPEYDPAAEVHHIITKIDPGASSAFRRVGLSGDTLGIVLPGGSDGVVDLESMFSAVAEHIEVTFPEPAIAHGPPSDLFGRAPSQTTSEEVGNAIRIALESRETAGLFSPYIHPKPKREFDLRNIREAALDVPARNVVDVQPAHRRAGREPRDNHDDFSQRFDFELNPPPSHPIAGEVFWFVELHGVGGVSLDGVSVTADPGNPASVTVQIDPLAIGDVVLFASYETTGNKIAFARPIPVASQAPLGAALERIELLPDGITLPLGETIRPDIVAVYDDGTRITKWVTPADVASVTSSAPAVLSVADAPDWKALKAGTATITINAFGMSDQATVTVEAPPSPLTYAQWKAEVFSAQHLGDPSVSGDASDFDGDQLTTFFEYIIGGNPFLAESDHLPEPTEILVDGENRPAASIRISTRTLGEKVVVQRSSDLQVWEDLLTFSNEPDLSEDAVLDYIDGGSYLRLFFDAESGADTTFFRLAVNAPPGGGGEPREIPAGAVAHYPFDGNANDAIGTNHGTLNGPEPAPDRFGAANSAYHFDGDADDIILSEFLPIGTGDSTVAAWVKIPLPGTEDLGNFERVGTVLGNHLASPNTNWGIHDDGQMRVYWNTGRPDVYGNADLRDNQWHHVAWVRDKTGANEFRFYLDGKLDHTHPDARGDITFTTVHRIGGDRRAERAANFHGLMDDLVIYDRTLTEVEIGELAR